MKKSPVLWLLPLAAVLFFTIPSDLFALTAAKEKKLASLQTELQTKGKLSNSKQKNLDSLLAEKQAEQAAAVNIVQPPESIGNQAAADPIQGQPVAPQPVTEPAVISGTSTVEDAKNVRAPSFVKPAEQGQEPGDPAIPSWVLDPSLEEQNQYVIGIGSAKSSSPQLSIQMAEARARQDIAFQLNVQVQGKITDYAENQGNSAGSEYNFSQDAVSQRIGQQLTNIELNGVKVGKREVDHNGTWWVKVLWSKENADKTAADISKTVIAEVVPLSPAEKAELATKLLDEQLDKAKLKSTPAVSEPVVVNE
ncbi:hypothetical protein FACS1894109_13930 [Spirochaetia bacterium]|nr:hypothetical protein FACS1894109_13930 [Spirochaetia bacterium]